MENEKNQEENPTNPNLPLQHDDDDEFDDDTTTNQNNNNIFKKVHNQYKRKPKDPNYVDDIHEMIDFHQYPFIITMIILLSSTKPVL